MHQRSRTAHAFTTPGQDFKRSLYGSQMLNLDYEATNDDLILGLRSKPECLKVSPILSKLYIDTGQLAMLFDTLELTPKQIEEMNHISIANVDPETCKMDSNGSIIAASFEQLILYLTAPDLPNIDFQKVFLITFPSFATPSHVLCAIMARYYAPIQEGSLIDSALKQKQVKDRVIRILSTWLKLTAYQFDDIMIQAIEQFIGFLEAEESTQMQAQVLSQSLSYTKGHRYHVYRRCPIPPPDIVLPEGDSSRWTLMSIPPVELARQVTLYNSKIFRKIRPNELLTLIWGADIANGTDNVTNLVKYFNTFSITVSHSVIKGNDPIERGRIVKKWIDVAEAFYSMNNFNGVFAVIYGITHRCVKRMEKTMKVAMKTNSHRKEMFKKLVTMCDTSNNFLNYRTVLNTATEPCIPFFSCFQKDLIYVKECIPNTIDGLINVKKCSETVKTILYQIDKFQNERYPFIKERRIQEIIRNLTEDIDTIELMKISHEKEPPVNRK